MSALTISIASGKGGTGKTTLAVAMALSLVRAGQRVRLLDADVEEPNDHLFLKVEPEIDEEVAIPVPLVDEAACTGCGLCREACAFNAIAILAERPLIFPELCHGCGACSWICPEKAISETPNPIGWLERAEKDGLSFLRGRMRVGTAMAAPVVKRLRRRAASDGITIIDAPPGTSCPVIAATHHADYVILVTEPTPFGLNDLELAVGMLRVLGTPFGVVINRSDLGDGQVLAFCEREEIPILMDIPFKRSIAEAYATGRPLIEAEPQMAEQLRLLTTRIAEELQP